MKGVYIDMEMPKEGSAFAIAIHPNGDITSWTGREMPQYKAVSVPPHGDLIDRDALYKEFERSGWFNNADRDIAEDALLDAPTVIEEEKGE